MESGEERGKAQGEKQKALDTAAKLLAEGLDQALIARATGLLEAEVADMEGF